MSASRQEQPLGDPYGGLLAWIYPPNYFAPARPTRTISDGSSDFESNNYWRSALTLRRVSSTSRRVTRRLCLDIRGYPTARHVGLRSAARQRPSVGRLRQTNVLSFINETAKAQQLHSDR